MKRYKLLKDLPYAKAGEVFERKIYNSKDGLSDYDYLEVRKRVEVGEDEVCFGIKYNYFLNNFDEWFEEIQEEPTDSIHWNPMIGEKCFILVNANIIPTLFTGKLRDYNAWRTGRVFRTEEECEKARDRELAEVRLRRTSTFEPDFTLGRGGYSIFYDHIFCGLRVHSLSAIDNGEIVRYETKEEAEKSIEENEQDWLTYFNVEDC